MWTVPWGASKATTKDVSVVFANTVFIWAEVGSVVLVKFDDYVAWYCKGDAYPRMTEADEVKIIPSKVAQGPIELSVEENKIQQEASAYMISEGAMVEAIRAREATKNLRWFRCE